MSTTLSTNGSPLLLLLPPPPSPPPPLLLLLLPLPLPPPENMDHQRKNRKWAQNVWRSGRLVVFF
jgi:hypothetical protein